MKVLLLGIGNLLFGDEGIGVHFINYIGKKYSFEGDTKLDIIDGGTLAQRLIPMMVEYDEIIIIDTINAANVKAGELYFFNFEDVPDAVDWQGSAHEVEMLQTLIMMDLVGDRPKTMIMGVVPTVVEATEFSLSQAVVAAVPLMEEVLLNYLKTLDIYTLNHIENITIDSIVPYSFKSANIYRI
ncbi:MAG: hydrogenase expression/formation protein [Arcobacter sp.]|nr:MAG: hydrogenase expression/formation protein [Arcobacter sp.]